MAATCELTQGKHLILIDAPTEQCQVPLLQSCESMHESCEHPQKSNAKATEHVHVCAAAYKL